MELTSFVKVYRSLWEMVDWCDYASQHAGCDEEFQSAIDDWKRLEETIDGLNDAAKRLFPDEWDKAKWEVDA